MRARGRSATRWMAFIVTSFILTWAMAPQPAMAEQVWLSGWFHVIWADPYPGSHVDAVQAFAIIDDEGRWTPIALDEALTSPFGGARALNRRRVKIVGERMSALHGWDSSSAYQAIQAHSIEFEGAGAAGAAAAEASPLAVAGSQLWVTVLCRFADSTEVTPHDASWFTTLMSSARPGMDHYWKELSYENINLTGSVVVGWYNLPQPKSYYVDSNETKLDSLLNDCTAAADADVFFPNYSGINLMFNQDLDCCAWGGSSTLMRDGQTKFYSVTWMPVWGYNQQSVLGHEMGHGFGLPHSNNWDGDTSPYDSPWDVMSAR